MGQLTDLLGRMQCGDAEARDALFAAAFAEIARRMVATHGHIVPRSRS